MPCRTYSTHAFLHLLHACPAILTAPHLVHACLATLTSHMPCHTYCTHALPRLAARFVAHLVAHMMNILPNTLKPCRAYKIIHLGEYMYILLFWLSSPSCENFKPRSRPPNGRGGLWRCNTAHLNHQTQPGCAHFHARRAFWGQTIAKPTEA